MNIKEWPSSLPVLLLLQWCSVGEVNGARILALLPHTGRSHFIAFEPYLRYLTTVGHEVVVYSHFPLKNPPPNYTDVSFAGSFGSVKDSSTVPPFIALLPLKPYILGFLFGPLGVYECYKALGSKTSQSLLNSNEKFDLIITELFNADCFLPFVHKFQAPNIALSSSAPVPAALDRFGNPDNPAYIANLFQPLSDKMNFLQRLSNTIGYLYTRAMFYFLYHIPSEIVARLYFGLSTPWLSDIAYNTSLLLLNTHHIINCPRPYMPNIVEVGGIHLPKVKRLPGDIAKFMDEAKYGVVYVSFGSLLNSEDFSDEKLNACIHAFARLKQRVLWKWSAELHQRPANLITRSWIPQFDVLNHPNVLAFVTHGGLLGTMEAVHNAVPVVVMPFFGDQDNNAKNIVRLGVGIELLYSDLNMENLLHALNQLIYNKSYKENAITASKIFRDRPQTSMETAIYWTEYVLNHQGAPHLQSAAKHLNTFQYLLLDVIIFFIFLITTFFGILYFFVKRLLLVHLNRKTM